VTFFMLIRNLVMMLSIFSLSSYAQAKVPVAGEEVRAGLEKPKSTKLDLSVKIKLPEQKTDFLRVLPPPTPKERLPESPELLNARNRNLERMYGTDPNGNWANSPTTLPGCASNYCQ
jgi:hypothetical protein